MYQKFLLCAGALLAVGMMQGCKSDNPAQPPSDNRTVLFSDNFENGLTKWPKNYEIELMKPLAKFIVSTAAAQSGKNSITADSNNTALVTNVESGADSGIVGLEFHLRANVAGNINFSLQIGKNAGSSGGCTQRYGIGVNADNKIVCIWNNREAAYPDPNDMDTAISAIELNKWYKCNVEINYHTSPWSVVYMLDGVTVATRICPTALYGIDRILALRQTDGDSGLNPKPYFADDIVFYQK